jgi:hypothetical protein
MGGLVYPGHHSHQCGLEPNTGSTHGGTADNVLQLDQVTEKGDLLLRGCRRYSKRWLHTHIVPIFPVACQVVVQEFWLHLSITLL